MQYPVHAYLQIFVEHKSPLRVELLEEQPIKEKLEAAFFLQMGVNYLHR